MRNTSDNKIIIFKTEDERISVDVRFEGETVWLTIDNMAKLFEKSRATINEHILNIYAEHELEESETVRKIGNSDFSTQTLSEVEKSYLNSLKLLESEIKINNNQ